MSKDKPRRLFDEFVRDLDEIKLNRIKLGLDKIPLGDSRLTRGIKLNADLNSKWLSIKDSLSKLPRAETLGDGLKKRRKYG